MNTISGIRSMLTKQADHTVLNDGADSRIEKTDDLKTAMQAVDRQISSSEGLRVKAEIEQMEASLVAEVIREVGQKELNEAKLDETPTITKELKSSDTTEELKSDDATEELKSGDTELITGRTMELKRKQKSLQDMRSQIKDSSTLLNSIAKHSGLLSDYLTKTEVDLHHLENVESKSTKLLELVAAVSRIHQETKLELADQQKQIMLLNVIKSKNRNTIEQIQTESNRLNAEVKTLANEIQSREFQITKLNDDKLALVEQKALLLAQNNDYAAEIDLLNEKLATDELQMAAQEKMLAKNAHTIKVLGDERDQGAVEYKDMQARYTSLNVKFTELQSQLEDKTYLLEAERKSFEEQLRRRDSRILKLEAEIGVLIRQLAKFEEKTATLMHDLDEVHKAQELAHVRTRKTAPGVNPNPQSETNQAILN